MSFSWLNRSEKFRGNECCTNISRRFFWISDQLQNASAIGSKRKEIGHELSHNKMQTFFFSLKNLWSKFSLIQGLQIKIPSEKYLQFSLLPENRSWYLLKFGRLSKCDDLVIKTSLIFSIPLTTTACWKPSFKLIMSPNFFAKAPNDWYGSSYPAMLYKLPNIGNDIGPGARFTNPSSEKFFFDFFSTINIINVNKTHGKTMNTVFDENNLNKIEPSMMRVLKCAVLLRRNVFLL